MNVQIQWKKHKKKKRLNPHYSTRFKNILLVIMNDLCRFNNDWFHSLSPRLHSSQAIKNFAWKTINKQKQHVWAVLPSQTCLFYAKLPIVLFKNRPLGSCKYFKENPNYKSTYTYSADAHFYVPLLNLQQFFISRGTYCIQSYQPILYIFPHDRVQFHML